MNPLPPKTFCQLNDTIEWAFHVMDEEGLQQCFITDKEHRLLGRISLTDLRNHIRDGHASNECVSEIMKKQAPFLINTEMEDEEEFEKKISYLKNAFSLSNHDLIAICDNELHVLYTSPLQILLQAKLAREESHTDEKSDGNIKRVCIIGGAGYLGTVLTEMLIQANYRVKIYDVFIFGKASVFQLQSKLKQQGLEDRLEIYEGDMRNTSDVMKALENADAVILLGAIVGDPASTKYPISTFEINYLAAQTIAEVCAYLNINKFVYASTCSVYGQNEDGSMLNEESSLRPVSHYARTKINAERAILAIDAPNFSPTILRLSTLYGPSYRMRYDLVVNTMLMKGLTTGVITVFGGQQWRPLLSVQDAARAFVSVIQSDMKQVKRQIFNVGDENENYQISAIGEIVCKHLKQAGHPIRLDIVQQNVDARDYKVSFEKIRSLLGFQTQDRVETVLDRLYETTVNVFNEGRITDVTHYNDQNAMQDATHGTIWEEKI